jgi:GMP synthase (glutamine-hydrolysing)
MSHALRQAAAVCRRLYPRRVAVELVFTERRTDLTRERARNLERLRKRLVEAAGMPVAVAHYEEVDPPRIARASALVLSGSSAAWSSRDPVELARLEDAVLAAGRPVLGICAGMQLQAVFAGGSIGPCQRAEHGFLSIQVEDGSDLLQGLPTDAVVFQDHDDEIKVLPEGFRVLASSPVCAVQAIAAPRLGWWGTQFHPEESSAEHPDGARVLERFFELAT